jgi:DNA mismatch repair protein MutS
MSGLPATTGFVSVLFPGSEPPAVSAPDPDCLRDLNVDQLIAGLAGSRKDYDIAPFYQELLADRDAIAYRQAVMRDLEAAAVWKTVHALADELRDVRHHLAHAREAYYLLERQRWFLQAAERYTDAVERFVREAAPLQLESEALRALRDYAADSVNSTPFRALGTEAREVASELAAIRYTLLIREGTVTVRDLGPEAEYGPLVEATFERFRREPGRSYRSPLKTRAGMNHIQAQILDRIARLHPEAFRKLRMFWDRQPRFPDPLLIRFEREIQFYFAFLDAIRPIRDAGLPFCYPRMTSSKAIRARRTFDLVLAKKLVAERRTVVLNDIELQGPERLLVVSGPNQSGKTTFARTVGQVHFLAALGCPVPGSDAELFHFDRILTRFEREENLENQRGKLKDDLIRLKRILDRATPDSLVILNEVFSSTPLQDQLLLSQRVIELLRQRDLIGVWVTFLRELASLGKHTVSVVSGVDPQDPAIRTFRLERKPATGLAYALVLAEKHGVTYQRLRERIGTP